MIINHSFVTHILIYCPVTTSWAQHIHNPINNPLHNLAWSFISIQTPANLAINNQSSGFKHDLVVKWYSTIGYVRFMIDISN
jgi:hypothetical protein